MGTSASAASPTTSLRSLLEAAYGQLNTPREPLNATAIYRERNAAAGWRAAVDQVNAERRR